MGFTLVEVLAGMAILAGGVLVFMLYQKNDANSVQYIKYVSSFNSLKEKADRLMIESQAVLESAQPNLYAGLGANINGNKALDFCLNGKPAAADATYCLATDYPQCCKAVTRQPFLFLDSTDPTYASVFAGAELSSTAPFTTTLAPARYDRDGMKCTSASENCVFELVTNFTATCAGGATRCEKAENVFVEYKLRNAAGVSVKGGPALPEATPPFPIRVNAVSDSIIGIEGGSENFLKVTRGSLKRMNDLDLQIHSDSLNPICADPPINCLTDLCKNICTGNLLCSGEFGPSYEMISLDECLMLSQKDSDPDCKKIFRKEWNKTSGEFDKVILSDGSSDKFYPVGCVNRNKLHFKKTVSNLFKIITGDGDHVISAVRSSDSSSVNFDDFDSACSAEFGSDFRMAQYLDCFNNTYYGEVSCKNAFIEQIKPATDPSNPAAVKIKCKGCSNNEIYPVLCAPKKHGF